MWTVESIKALTMDYELYTLCLINVNNYVLVGYQQYAL